MHDPSYMTIPRPPEPILAAVKYFGGQKQLADAISYSQQSVNRMVQRGRVTRRAAKAIELATLGQVTADSFEIIE